MTWKKQQYNEVILQKLPDILDAANVSYKKFNARIVGSCPIHGGDNNKAFNVYFDGIPNWVCYTHHCEQQYGRDLFSLAKQLLGKNDNELIEYLGGTITNNYQYDNFNYLAKNSIITNKKYGRITRNNILNTNLCIPSKYFSLRGYANSTLIKYDVGDCLDQTKPMKNRAVVPIYEQTGQYYVGCTARSIFEKCEICSNYHNPKVLCPTYEIRKWKHSDDLPRSDILYNSWFAKQEIISHNKAILVEGPADVWRLEEADIHYSLAMLGTGLSKNQISLLNNLGVLTLFLLLDNDSAGQDGIKTIEKILKQFFNVIRISISKKDVGEMLVDEVKNEICPILKSY